MREIDDLQLYFGSDIKINDHITIKQPTIGQIVDYGERQFLQAASMITAIPSDMISELFDAGIDWEGLPEYDFFIIYLSRQITPADCEFLFDGLNLSDYKPVNAKDADLVLKNSKTGNVIDRNIYRLIAEYVRRITGIKRKPKKAANKFTKQIMIDLDRNDKKNKQREQFESDLLPLMSAMLNSPEFKYDLRGVRDLPYYTFIDSINRISAIKHADALLNGCFTGMADLSKIPKDEFNWLRDLSE